MTLKSKTTLIQLVERGCPPELAARIMAPIDWSLSG